jgi:hypothetical protein
MIVTGYMAGEGFMGQEALYRELHCFSLSNCFWLRMVVLFRKRRATSDPFHLRK